MVSTTTPTSLDRNKFLLIVLVIVLTGANHATTTTLASDERSVLSFLLAPGYTAGSNETIELALEQLAPDLRQLRDFTLPATSNGRAYDDAKSLQMSLGAWKLMRQQTHEAVNSRLKQLEPILVEFLNEARVSSQCLLASKRTLDAAKSLESWAIQLFSSWASFPPSGLFEGTLGDLGSYYGCMQVPENAQIKHAHYCTISFRPLMPPRTDFELIMTPLGEPLKSLFGQPSSSHLTTNNNSSSPGHVDIFADLIDFSQYFHYVFLKLGTCFPIDCSPHDVQRVARLIGRRWNLQTGPVKCNSKFASDYTELELEQTTSTTFNSEKVAAGSGVKAVQKALQISTTRDLNNGVFIWKPHITTTQFWTLLILGSILLAISSATLADLLLNQIPRLQNHVEKLIPSSSQSMSSPALLGDREREQSAPSVQQHELDVLHKSSEEDANNNVTYSKSPIINANGHNNHITQDCSIRKAKKSLIGLLVQDLSIFENAKSFFNPISSQRDISCLHGIRCLTMMWIIITHTMQYNDWSAFARAREVEVHLRSLVTQPLFNGSYLVDTFFVMSGLLTSYTIFSQRKTLRELGKQFSCFQYLLNRYLRLTPAMLFVSGLFILLPLSYKGSAGSPHWYTVTGEYSEFCTRNWWVQALHAQAFYNHAEMCNFASWWISVDSFFHLIALFALLIIFSASCSVQNSISTNNNDDDNNNTTQNINSAARRSRKYALGACLSLTLIGLLVQFGVHYYFKLPPNMMSTIPQTEAMFSISTLYFYWTPFSHSIPFFLGLLTGYLLARERELLLRHMSWPRALTIWSITLPLFGLELYSTYPWIVGNWNYKPYPLMTSAYNVTCTFWWSATLIWIIVACKLDYGGPINTILSCKIFKILSRASYLVYLSHFLVLFTFFGSQNLLLEPSQLLITYVMVGNIFISMVFGSFLCVTLEMPWLKLHKRLMSKVPTNKNHQQQQQRTNDAIATHSSSLGA